MAYLSPGVYVTEEDLSTIVPSVVSNVAFFAGEFTKGQCGVPYVITNKEELERNFGTPTDSNYNQWFQCFKFFDYGDQLIVTRAYTDYERPDDIDDITTSTSAPKTSIYTGFRPVDTNEGEDPADGNYVFFINKGNSPINWELPEFENGDLITFGQSQDPKQIVEIRKFEFICPDPTAPDYDPDDCSIKVYCDELHPADFIEPPEQETGFVYLHSFSFKNGETQAMVRGDVDDNTNTPLNPNAVHPGNIDYIDPNNTCNQCYSDRRLNFK
jgi:hypothetical protein